MNLKNGYKILYAEAASGWRTFFADKLDGTAADQIGDAIKIGKYKLVYEKDGKFYGSTSGMPTKGDDCFEAFDRIFKEATEEPVVEPTNIDNKVEEDEPEVVVEDEPTNGDNGETSNVEAE